jgi:protein TonB
MILATAAVAALVIAFPAAQSEQTYQPGKGVSSPVLKKEVKPSYTEGAMRRKVQGRVFLSVVVLKDGTVSDDVQVTQSLDEELDQQAIIAVKQWRFEPGRKDGEPVNVQVHVEMTFTLRDRK